MKMNESRISIDMKRTGLKLQEFARQNGYSVKDIQEYLCLSCPQPVYRWYKGSILPSVDNLLRLSELFHVHMEELLVKEMPIQECIIRSSMEYYHHTNDRHSFYKRMKAYYSQLAS